MSPKRIFEDIPEFSCPLCGAPILKDSRKKRVKYFCTGEKMHDLTNNRALNVFLISNELCSK